MKATIEVPDDHYRKVKAKSALQGKRVREVAIHLFRGWIDEPDEVVREGTSVAAGRPAPAWFGAARKYARRVSRHDLDSIRRSIGQGRVREGPASAAKVQTP